jgi:mRNA-degrading endonuclease HigB of HigAB toxin-antitoxin module
VRVLGRDVVEAHLAERRFSPEGDALRAWLYELEHCEWTHPARLSAAFQRVDLSAPPSAIFHLASAPLRIETLIDFRTRIVLVTRIADSEITRRHGTGYRGIV